MTNGTDLHTPKTLRFPLGLSIMGIFWVLLLGRYTGGADSDTLWHLLAGNYMLANQVILKTDIFSWTMIGKPWFPAEWLYEVVIAFLNLHFGAKGLIVLHALATAVQMGILYRLSRQIGASSWWSGFVAGGLTYSMSPYITLRPQVFSYLLFTWMLSILLQRFKRPLVVYLLPVLSLIWVNFHLSFILLILWVGFEWVIGFFRLRIGRLHQHAYRHQLHLSAAWLLSVAATLLNPETYHVYPYVWSISNNQDLKNNI
ncbi:MAG: hypothetical protein JWN30_1259, partial [Bacilli bacterium]|nr:hypothetical protein [Bacilli bacterium]